MHLHGTHLIDDDELKIQEEIILMWKEKIKIIKDEKRKHSLESQECRKRSSFQ